ncbi:alpha/beta hydrolase [Fuscibacter oryzae]|uniref:Alpha/beta hydrolase n=1 Tax=Fuscibacter oryzae TaxID=2803939 RepID=A0A8J7MPR0_9RHOB|nr:alpha/beta hydrolase [Fuscibacter oryzae]MBL4928860.1 alpha/beta hydrolase [Fuscibacter oryzae]
MDMDREYANGAFIPGSEGLPDLWAQKAAGFRAGLGARFSTHDYGPGPRQKLDLFRPEGAARGLMMFVHGGYWLEFGRESWSHLAAGAVARGWAVAMPSYTLAPAVRISDMTHEVAAAVQTAAALVAGPVVVTGHSAGGHLAARMACPDQQVPVARVVPISPLADLRPLRATAMNADLRINEAEALTESPCQHPLRASVQAHVWVGGQERPAFLWQARTLSESWACDWTVAPGLHHFNVIDGLESPGSALMAACLDGL